MAPGVPPLPLSYRAELLKPLMMALQSGECCSLIGIGGTGKSNLGRFLARHDVQAAYWGDYLCWAILIDSQSLVFEGERPEYSLTEELIQRLIMEAERRSFAPDFLEWASALHRQLTERPGAQLALKCLQDLCRRLCEEYGARLVFVFDQFEDLWRALAARFFLNLRSLRDQFKYQVIYLTITRDRLQYLRQDAQAVEAFWELFSTHTYYLGAYSEADALVMVERLAQRAGIASADVPSEVVEFSGRHPGLLRAVFWAAREGSLPSFTLDALLRVPAVGEECAKIWKTLSQDEQDVARSIAQGLPIQHALSDALTDLQFKGIIAGDPPVLFSPLFTAYVLQRPGNDVQGVVVDVRLRQVWLDGQLLPRSLSPLEFRLLAYLARHVGSVCTREKLVHELYNESIYDKFDQRLYALLSRLREELGETTLHPRYLITHRGGGIQLKQGGIRNDETI